MTEPRITYSKPSSDVMLEADAWLKDDGIIRARQATAIERLLSVQPRIACLLCLTPLADAERFDHRGVPYLCCPTCGHIQTLVEPPPAYPFDAEDRAGFATTYPPLEPDAYRSRRDRIYAPKLAWALSCLEEAGWTRQQAMDAKWLELGAGAGYFLDALRAAGARHWSGLDADAALATQANQVLGMERVAVHTGSLAEAVRAHPAAVYAAFFVLEHVPDAAAFWEAMADQPAGTAFVFAVPVFGFATIVESAFGEHAARQLDSVLHTQLYTERSMAYALDRAGWRVAGSWVFGQDALDLRRLLLQRLEAVYPAGLRAEAALALGRLADPLQSAIDRAHLAEARHIVAIKR
jgi:hypothetical protein